MFFSDKFNTSCNILTLVGPRVWISDNWTLWETSLNWQNLKEFHRHQKDWVVWKALQFKYSRYLQQVCKYMYIVRIILERPKSFEKAYEYIIGGHSHDGLPFTPRLIVAHENLGELYFFTSKETGNASTTEPLKSIISILYEWYWNKTWLRLKKHINSRWFSFKLH